MQDHRSLLRECQVLTNLLARFIMKIGGGPLVIASSLLLAFWSGPSLAFVPRVTPLGTRQKALPPLHFKVRKMHYYVDVI